MSGHTPGPWRVLGPINASDWGIAVQRGDEGGFVVSAKDKDREKADAHLIAAAPELLAALWEIVAIGSRSEPQMNERSLTALNFARAAIAKARGEA